MSGSIVDRGRSKLSVPGCGVGKQSIKKLLTCLSDRFDGAVECSFVGSRRTGRATQLTDELYRRGTNLLIGCGRIKVEQSLDVSAHESSLYCLTGVCRARGITVATDRVERLCPLEIWIPPAQARRSHRCPRAMQSRLTYSCAQALRGSVRRRLLPASRAESM